MPHIIIAKEGLSKPQLRIVIRGLTINVLVAEVDNMPNISITTHGSSKTPDTPFPPDIHPSNRSTNAQFPNLLQDLLNPTIQLTLRILFSRIRI